MDPAPFTSPVERRRVSMRTPGAETELHNRRALSGSTRPLQVVLILRVGPLSHRDVRAASTQQHQSNHVPHPPGLLHQSSDRIIIMLFVTLRDKKLDALVCTSKLITSD
jgi:hypothetical protein